MDKVHSTNSKAPTISIVMPIYNMEAYLQESINSVLNQSFKDFELILVDDESPDRCGEICDNAALKDYRIYVVHQRNGGELAARKGGVAVAQGTWICFIDPDDRLPPNALKELVSACDNSEYEMEDFDIIEGSHVRFMTDLKSGKEIYVKHHNDFYTQKSNTVIINDGIDYLKDLVTVNNYFTGAAWRKLIRRSVINEADGLNVPREFFAGGDVISTLIIATKVRKVLKIPSLVYEYRINPKSVTELRGAEAQTFRYVSSRWCAIKKVLENVYEYGEEFYKLYIAKKWLNSFIVDRQHTWRLRSLEFKPYLDILQEKWYNLSLLAKTCLLVTRFPFTLIPEHLYFLLLFGIKAVVFAPKHLVLHLFFSIQRHRYIKLSH